MTRKHWLRAILLSATAAAMPPVWSAAQVNGGTTPTEVAALELGQLRDVLLDASDKRAPRERDEAAKRLLDRLANDARAGESLLEALRSGKSEPQVAVARALAEAENPPVIFLDGLKVCLTPQMSAEAAAAVSLAIANYRDDASARQKLRDFILSANVPERVRIPAVKAVGTLSDKESAQFLAQTLLLGDDRRISRQLSEAAADALVEMTGLTEYGQDVGQWERWWQAQAAKTPQQFLDERRQERDVGARLAAEQFKQLAASVESLVRDTFLTKTTDADRETFLLRCLKDPAPATRSAGASMVNLALNENLPIATSVKERLREMIGDSSPEVRRRVAGAIAGVNDPGAAKSLVAQLQREQFAAVRAAIIQALAPTKDVSAVPDLVKALEDRSSLQVAEAAARALADLGPEIAKNRVLTADVSRALVRTIERTNNLRGAYRLRERTVEAMIPLRNPELVQTTLFALLAADLESNTPGVRRFAIQALRDMNPLPKLQTDIANAIASTSLVDREKGVRLEAAKALGVIGSPAQQQALLNAMTPNRESDADVRAAAWTSLSSLFDQFDQQSLFTLVESQFRDDPDRKLTVYLSLNKKLEAAVKVDPAKASSLAVVQQDIGALYADPRIDKHEAAIPYYKSALTYWTVTAPKGGGQRIESLQNGLLRSYLRAKRFDEGIAFAAERIKVEKSNSELGRVILDEADRLVERNELKAAAELLTAAKALQIEGSIGVAIDEREKSVRSRILPFHDSLREIWRGVFA